MVDSDGDSVTDGKEALDGTDPLDSNESVWPDFSDSADTVIGASLGLDSIEGNLMGWYDASNIDAENNSTLNPNDPVARWMEK